MTSRLRFQTKLMLAMVLTIVVVTVAFVTVTERKIRQSYVKIFSEDFETQVEQLRKSRDERMQEELEISSSVAKDDYLVRFLKGSASADDRISFMERYKDLIQKRIQPEMAKRGGFGAGGLALTIAQKSGLVAVMDLEGDINSLSHPQVSENQKFARRAPNYTANNAEDRLARIAAKAGQQIGYFPVESRDGRPVVQEIVATPVNDPDTNDVLGFFLRGTSSDTPAERFLERYNAQFANGEGLKSGIYLGGDFYARQVPDDEAAVIGKAIKEELIQEYRESGSLNLTIDELPYRIQYEALNPESSLPVAYQTIVFPLAQLYSDLNDLRLRGSAIGIFAILAGLIMAGILARNLSIPVRELAEGTRNITEGDYDQRVRVRSSDEIGELARSFNHMAEELKQKAKFRELLGKVSDEAVAQAMISGTLDLELGGEQKLVTVLFCDIRGFSDLIESMDPTEVIEIVNSHMTAMTRIVREHYGVVDKFVGDEVMAVFGGLKTYDNDAHNAVVCATEMIAERNRLNRELGQDIHVGIGIATGDVVAGCMGSTDRLNYTVLGSRVNLASRLCGTAEAGEIIIDEATCEAANVEADDTETCELDLKGFSRTITAYRMRDRLSKEAAISTR